MITLITSLGIAVFSIYLLLMNPFNYFVTAGVPQFPLSMPYGNIKGMFTDYHLIDFIVKYYKKTKDIGAKFSGVYLFIRPTLFVVDLDLVKHILVKDFDKFASRGVYYNESEDPVSAHLFNLDGGEGWKALRKKLTPTFTTGKIKAMFSTIVDITENLLTVIDKKIATSGQLEVKDTLSRFTIDVIGSTAFGMDCNAMETQDLELYKRALKINLAPKNIADFLSRVAKAKWMGLCRKLGVRLIPEDESSFYLDITRKTVEYREKNPNVKRQDFMNLLIELKKDNLITVEQIAAQSYVFLFAGFETSSSTMTFCIYELSLNEAIQEKARKSVREAVEKHNGLSYEAIADMQYLDQCVDETLRKYPVVPVLLRCATQNVTIPGTKVTIPKGQTVYIPVYGIHHDPDIYPEPQNFIPERFAPELKAERHPFAFIPFGEGPRICIGLRFGMIETKLTIAQLLLNYRFSLDRAKVPLSLPLKKEAFMLEPQDEIYVNVEKIH